MWSGVQNGVVCGDFDPFDGVGKFELKPQFLPRRLVGLKVPSGSLYSERGMKARTCSL
jgi:hypothetical protein